MEKRLRIVIKEFISGKDVDHLAVISNWILDKEIHATQTRPYQKIWTTNNESTAIHYIEDELLLVRYLQVKGEKVEDVAAYISSLLGVYTKNEIIDKFKSAHATSDAIDAVYYACIAAPPNFHQEYFELFKQGMTHTNAEIRRSTIFATTYVRWEEFKPLLNKIIIEDSDLEVQEDAKIALQGLVELDKDNQ